MEPTRRDDLRFVELPGRASADPFAGRDGLPVSVRVVRIDPGGDRRPHRHPHSCEVVHVLRGRGRAWEDGTWTDIGAGDTFVVRASRPHATLALPGEVLELLCVFPHPDLETNLEELDGPRLEL